MNRSWLAAPLLLATLLVGCGESHPGGVDPSEPVTGQIVLPPSFTNGTPYTSSTPFTNSTPAPGLVAKAQASLPRQIVLAIDPLTGRTVSGVESGADGRFSFTVPNGYQSLVLQVIVKDSAGRIRGLVASAIHPDEPANRLLTPGSTVVPLAGALATGEGASVTFGSGFAGVARPKLGRVLALLDQSAVVQAAARYDASLSGAVTANAVMQSVATTAMNVAAQVAATPGEDPATIGDRLDDTLAHAAPVPDPVPSAQPSPDPAPSAHPWSPDPAPSTQPSPDAATPAQPSPDPAPSAQPSPNPSAAPSPEPGTSAPTDPPGEWMGHGPAVPAPWNPHCGAHRRVG